MDVSLAQHGVLSESVIAAGRNLSAELDVRLGEAADSWGISVPGGLAAKLSNELAAAADPFALLAGLRLDELVLAQACAAGDPRALAVFEAQFLTRVPELVARRSVDAGEVGQILRERLLVAAPNTAPRIAEYAGRGSLAGWLRVAALRTASNLRRSERPTADLAHADAALHALTAASPELAVLAERYGSQVREAMRDAFRALDATERTLLRLHHLDGLTVEQLAPILGTSRATAGRRLIAARERLGAVTLALLADRTHATPAELRSVLRVLVSRLDVSLRGVMTDSRDVVR